MREAESSIFSIERVRDPRPSPIGLFGRNSSDFMDLDERKKKERKCKRTLFASKIGGTESFYVIFLLVKSITRFF